MQFFTSTLWFLCRIKIQSSFGCEKSFNAEIILICRGYAWINSIDRIVRNKQCSRRVFFRQVHLKILAKLRDISNIIYTQNICRKVQWNSLALNTSLLLYTLIISVFFTVLMSFSSSSILNITTEQRNNILLSLRDLYAP